MNNDKFLTKQIRFVGENPDNFIDVSINILETAFERLVEFNKQVQEREPGFCLMLTNLDILKEEETT